MNQHQVIAAGYSACVALFDEGNLDAWALLGLDMLWDESREDGTCPWQVDEAKENDR